MVGEGGVLVGHETVIECAGGRGEGHKLSSLGSRRSPIKYTRRYPPRKLLFGIFPPYDPWSLYMPGGRRIFGSKLSVF